MYGVLQGITVIINLLRVFKATKSNVRCVSNFRAVVVPFLCPSAMTGTSSVPPGYTGSGW